MEELNENQQIFITEYLANGLNGAKAYLTAYGDMDYNCACASASRLLSNVKINMRNDIGGYDFFNSFTTNFATRVVRCPG